ncbi:MAG: DNA recombination protein RmuC, partial [Dehalococcoidia bacterium]|nr:DNA recombination protein RmuC [Dehalococcoidia bacterium]
EEFLRENETRRRAELDAVIDGVRASFGTLSLEALSRSSEELLKLAQTRLQSEREVTLKELESKKELIDLRLQQFATELRNVSTSVTSLEKDRHQQYGEVANQLKFVSEQAMALGKTTGELRQALASSRIRGQWGERMAEDILRLCGFVENISYFKQKTIEGMGARPDFTFPLPQGKCVNMDVKFPLDNYLRYCEADSVPDKERHCRDFLGDVRGRMREVAGRAYISPEQNTVDYALMFIPNEQIYAFLHEHDGAMLEDAIRSRVVLCSPVTLFAVLAVIRHAVDSFALQESSNEILSLLGAFRKQWDEFTDKLDALGKRIGDTQKAYETLSTTRRRQLEKPLNRIEEMRLERGLTIAPAGEDVPDLDEGGERADP